MKVELKKWGNSIGFRVPHKVAESLGWDEFSVVELTKVDNALVITKQPQALTLDEVLASIPEDFQYLDDVGEFSESQPLGREML